MNRTRKLAIAADVLSELREVVDDLTKNVRARLLQEGYQEPGAGAEMDPAITQVTMARRPPPALARAMHRSRASTPLAPARSCSALSSRCVRSGV